MLMDGLEGGLKGMLIGVLEGELMGVGVGGKWVRRVDV